MNSCINPLIRETSFRGSFKACFITSNSSYCLVLPLSLVISVLVFLTHNTYMYRLCVHSWRHVSSSLLSRINKNIVVCSAHCCYHEVLIAPSTLPLIGYTLLFLGSHYYLRDLRISDGSAAGIGATSYFTTGVSTTLPPQRAVKDSSSSHEFQDIRNCATKSSSHQRSAKV